MLTLSKSRRSISTGLPSAHVALFAENKLNQTWDETGGFTELEKAKRITSIRRHSTANAPQQVSLPLACAFEVQELLAMLRSPVKDPFGSLFLMVSRIESSSKMNARKVTPMTTSTISEKSSCKNWTGGCEVYPPIECIYFWTWTSVEKHRFSS